MHISPTHKTKIIPVNVYKQETEYSCGAAIIRSLLGYYNMLGDMLENDVCNELGTRFDWPHPGTHPDQMVAYLRKLGFDVMYMDGCGIDFIVHYIDRDIPVIILDSSWGGHWRMIIGYHICNAYKHEDRIEFYIAEPYTSAIRGQMQDNKNIVIENWQELSSKWFENNLYERTRYRYAIVSHPQCFGTFNYNRAGE